MSEAEIYYLTVADLRAIAEDVAGPYVVRDAGLLASAAARAATTVFGTDAYPGIWEKSAALLHSIAANHPLVDGNKRLAIAGAIVFLAYNGIDTSSLDEDLTYNLMIDVASGAVVDIPEIASRLATALKH
ncbi:type II toxin-antitoxin system death-on-curing family toxin [Nocardia salmonicida]|uniref:type II toxin-antitoxin system death-on-curing family toxin n=1 Tax=Nocardia TaxID=1817 RepID=UPI00265A2CC0|nr:type II toxin-antitoxin system death-on-curing family toxin [Nocardia sp. PE-7]WKG10073.1 type II toxin-antitoxin system death-on-curing family toxin [Nocardia sp. PE-7]